MTMNRTLYEKTEENRIVGEIKPFKIITGVHDRSETWGDYDALMSTTSTGSSTRDRNGLPRLHEEKDGQIGTGDGQVGTANGQIGTGDGQIGIDKTDLVNALEFDEEDREFSILRWCRLSTFDDLGLNPRRIFIDVGCKILFQNRWKELLVYTEESVNDKTDIMNIIEEVRENGCINGNVT